MFEEISRFRGYCDWLIQYTHCPCNRAAPDPVACLGARGVDVAPDIPIPRSRPRAGRRRRSCRTALGKSADPDDGPPRQHLIREDASRAMTWPRETMTHGRGQS